MTPSRSTYPILAFPFRVNVTKGVSLAMSVAKVTEIISSSPKSFDAALLAGVKRAHKTLRNVQAAWVKSQQVDVKNGRIVSYRVTLKVTFVLTD